MKNHRKTGGPWTHSSLRKEQIARLEEEERLEQERRKAKSEEARAPTARAAVQAAASPLRQAMFRC